MGTLTRYIFKEFAKVLALCTATLVLVYLSIDFFEKIGRFVQQGASGSVIAQFFGLRLPTILFDTTPIALLVATLITLGIFSRNNEITAMKGNGISLLFITAPLLLIALGLSLVFALANLSLIPMTKQRAEFVRSVKIKKNTEQYHYGRSQLWLRDGRTVFANILFVDSVNHLLNEVTLYRVREDYSLEETIRAKRIHYEEGRWIMYDGMLRRFTPDGTMTQRTFEKEPIALTRKPEDFKGLDVDTDRMKFMELNHYVDRLEKDGYDVGRYRTDLYNKLLFPFVNFIMVLIAVPFGLMETRSRGISRGIGISLLIGSAYWIFHSISISLGHSGVLHPALAGGLPNLLFLSLGIYMYFGIRQ